MKRLRILFFTILLIAVSNMQLMAQAQNPCDPDNPCPLDTWVWVLVIAVTGLAVWQWYQQKKQAKHA